MGITNFVNRVSKATEEIRQAIIRKGVIVSECDSLEVMPDRIDQIEQSGGTGGAVYTVLAFISSASRPSTPTGGSLSDDLTIKYPSGWSDGASLTTNIWVSYAEFTKTGMIRNWNSPVKLSGSSSESTDLTDYALKTWVLDQIKNAVKDGTIDLSNYATKNYVDQKISEVSGGTAGVQSINGETGAITFTGDGVTKNGKTFTFTGGSSNNGVVSINSMKGVVTLKGDEDGSVIISRGTDGQSLIFKATGDGGGRDGDTIRTFLIYKNTDSNTVKPEIPSIVGSEPYWDINNGTLGNCPSGWSTDDVYELGKYTWIAFGFFSKNSAGAMQGTWEGPFCMTGEPGKPGKDGDNYEFIYALTKDSSTRPKYPTTESELKTLFDAVEQGDSSESYAEYQGQKWYDRAQSIDPITYKTCWVAQRMKSTDSSVWVYTQPILWANWGSDGIDGDGVEYIFFLTDDAHQSSGKWTSDAPNFKISYTESGTVNGIETAYDNKIDDWVPKGWTDEPQDVAPNKGLYEFCRIRKSKDGVWQEFGQAALWSKSPIDGKDGSDVEYVYATTNNDLDESKVSVDNDAANADGAHTTDEYLPYFVFDGTRVKTTDDPVSVTSTNKYQWVSIRRKKRGESEWGDFCHPSLWSMYGSGSSSGGDTYVPVTLFTAHSSYEDDDKPVVPAANSTYDKTTATVINPPEGWDMSATKTAENPYIWRINGVFSETTGKQIGRWQGPYCVSGIPGPSGKDGDETETAYALTADVPGAGYPTVDTTGTDPNGKTNADAGYLPKIVFSASESTQTTKDKQSPTSTKAYLYGTERRKNGNTLYEWSEPTLAAMWTYAGLDEGEIDKIKQQVSADVGAQVDTAYKKAKEVEDRLDKVVTTDAKFTTDATKGIISAVTEYKGNDKTAFAESIIDAGSASITQTVGAAVDDKISGVGTRLDALEGEAKTWATWKDDTSDSLTLVQQTLDAQEGKIQNAATKIEGVEKGISNVNSAIDTLDAKNATMERSVSKSQYIWVKEDTSNKIGTDSNGNSLYKIIEESPYAPGDSEDLTSYDSEMESAGWTKKLLSTALSQIRQAPGEIDLTAIDGDTAAGILIRANEDADETTIFMNAQRVNFSGVINAPTATFEGCEILTGHITEGHIKSATIEECTINSILTSYNYDNGTVSVDKTKAGFLFDPKKNEFAIYAKSPKWKSGDPDVVIASNEFKIPSAYIEEVITPSLIASKIDVSALEVSAIQSNPFTSGESGYKLNSDGTNATFEFYGTDESGNKFSLTNKKLEIPGAYIHDLTVDRLVGFDIEVQSQLDKYLSVEEGTSGNKLMNLSSQVKSFLAEDTDFTVNTLTTVNGGMNVYVGTDFQNAESDQIVYSSAQSKYDEGLTSSGTFTWSASSTNSITLDSTSNITVSPFDVDTTNFVVGTHTGKLMKVDIYLANASGTQIGSKTSSTTSCDGTAEGHHTRNTTTFAGYTYTNVSAGTYHMQINITIEHAGNNVWSKSWCGAAIDAFTMSRTINISNEPGVFIGPNGFKLSDGTHEANVNLSESTSSGFSTKGFVMSPDDSILKIKRATSASNCTDSDTLYIILN